MGGVASHETGKLVGKKQIARNEYAYYVTRRDLELTHAERPPTPVWLPTLNAADPVYFVFERLSDASLEFWDRYGLLQERKTRLAIIPIGDGLVAFRETIAMYKKGCGKQYDMWVAYVTAVEPTTLSHRATLIPREHTRENFHTADQTRIEMVVTVLVDRNAPFTSHSGIFRTGWFWIPNRYTESAEPEEKLKVIPKTIPFGHKRLSLPLHQFAALMSRELYSHMKVHNSFMVTKPVDEMSDILRRSGLVAGKDFIAGTQKERTEKKHLPFFPPLNDPTVPLITESGPYHGTWETETDTHDAPEWMLYTKACGHRFLHALADHQDAVTYTIRLSSLAGLWPQGLRFGRKRARHGTHRAKEIPRFGKT